MEKDRDTVVEAIKALFNGRDGGPVKPEIKYKDKKDGKFYRATHCEVAIKKDDLDSDNQNLRDLTCEVQVCSLLAHVFNEIEHDLTHKPLAGELSEEALGFLEALGPLTDMGDFVIVNLLSAVNKGKPRKEQFNDENDFVRQHAGTVR